MLPAVRGVRRTKKAADLAFDEIHTNDELDALLPDTDILALALPATGETKGFLSAARLALLPKTAYVVNVGRGSAIDQAALLDALNHDRLAGAALDVFEQEPIPAGDPGLDGEEPAHHPPHLRSDEPGLHPRSKRAALL